MNLKSLAPLYVWYLFEYGVRLLFSILSLSAFHCTFIQAACSLHLCHLVAFVYAACITSYIYNSVALSSLIIWNNIGGQAVLGSRYFDC